MQPAELSPTHPLNATDKPRLTEQEKKNNHIASEQKRRQAIREGFDEIAALTPGMEGQGRSEALVLQGFTAEMKRQLARRWRLVALLEEQGKDTSEFRLDKETMDMAEQFAAQEDDEHNV